MRAYKHAFFEIDNTKYYDYDLLCSDDINVPDNGEYLIVDDMTISKLKDIRQLVDTTIKPPKGSSVWLSPDYPFAAADIRRNYKMKRTVDTADYNVFSDFEDKRLRIYRKYADYSKVIVIPSNKLIVIGSYNITEITLVQVAENFLGTIVQNGTYVYKIFHKNRSWDTESAYVIENTIYGKLLLNTLTKPCVYIKNLDLSTENELNLDMLKLYYSVCSKDYFSTDAKKNAIIQLNVLNQHNWRDYKGTVAAVNSLFCHTSVFSRLLRYKNSQPKPIAEILQYHIGSFKGNLFESEKDLKLAQEFFKDYLHIGDIKFSALTDLNERLHENNISPVVFTSIFNTIVRITPKEFKKENEAGD